MMVPTNRTAVSLFDNNLYMECSICRNILTEISGDPRFRLCQVNRDVALYSLSYRKRGMNSVGVHARPS